MAVAYAARQTPAPIEYLPRKAGLGQEESMPSSGRLNFISQLTIQLTDRQPLTHERETPRQIPKRNWRFGAAPRVRLTWA